MTWMAPNARPWGPSCSDQGRDAQSGYTGVDVLVDTRIEQDDLTELLLDGHPGDDHSSQGGG